MWVGLWWFLGGVVFFGWLFFGVRMSVGGGWFRVVVVCCVAVCIFGVGLLRIGWLVDFVVVGGIFGWVLCGCVFGCVLLAFGGFVFVFGFCNVLCRVCLGCFVCLGVFGLGCFVVFFLFIFVGCGFISLKLLEELELY